VEGDGWRVDVPDGFIAKAAAADGYDSGAIARGWIGDAPVTAVVQTRALREGFNAWVRRVPEQWLEHESRRVRVPGATDAVRIDGMIEFDGLGAKDDHERCTAICAKRASRAFILSVRSRPEDELGEQVEAILGSFALLEEVSDTEVSDTGA
jgi:hypothetical protein